MEYFILSAVILGSVGFLGFVLLRLMRPDPVATQKLAEQEAQAQQRALALDQAMAQIATSQGELTGRLQTLSEAQTNSQAQLRKAMEERLDKVSQRMNQGLTESSTKTAKSIGEITNRLKVIDEAQKNITDLSDEVVGLRAILSNKQRRGVFGETRLEDLVRDALPPSAYSFQTTLSNGRRADCVIILPNPPGPIIVDSKFPLESFNIMMKAADEPALKQARKQFQLDVLKHVKDISEKYIIPGETAESALMFLPSESIYAELHTNFIDVMEKSYLARVYIVSPTTLMATMNTVRAVLKDAKMREQAGLIQAEVGRLLSDVDRLQKRVGNLQSHFSLAEKDIHEITTSAGKIASRGEKIETVQLEEPDTAQAQIEQPPPMELRPANRP